MSDPVTSEPTQPIAPVQLKVKPKTLALITGGGLVIGALTLISIVTSALRGKDGKRSE